MKTTLCLSILTLAGVLLGESSIRSQTLPTSTRIPVADDSLGTQVSGTNNFAITGGLNRGQNVFHSFQDFSVPTGGSATFNNPVGNRAIITRVTGSSFSDIDGLINTQGANFFLINPNGMVFGANARLNVGQTFVGSTANGIDLVDTAGNSVNFGTNRSGDAQLLTINPNALFAARLNLGAGNGQISNFGTLQTANPNQYIGLIGGDINLNGGGIIAPGGRVDLGGLKSAGTVTATDKGLVFGGDNLVRGDVSLTNGAGVNVSAQQNLGNVAPAFGNASSPGSSINITANNVNLINNLSTLNTVQSNLQAGLGANTVTTVPTGDININATGKFTLDRGGIYNTILTGAQGQIGDIKIDANSLDLKNQSTIYSYTVGKGNAGNINIRASGNVNLTNQSTIRSETGGVGNAGNIDIKTAGNIDIAGTQEQITPSQTNSIQPALSFISSNTYGIGNTGKITLDTTGDVTFRNRGGIFSAIVGSTAQGNSQGIEIKNARNLTLKDNSSIQTSNTGGNGDTGKITLDTTGDITLSNRGVILSAIGSTAQGNSQGIEIKNARNLTLTNQSAIGTDNLGGTGDAGNIDIKTTGNINIIGIDPQSTLFQSNPNLLTLSFISSNTAGNGNTGKITLDTTGDIMLSNRGQISSAIRSIAQGNSQGIEIKNARNLTVKDNSIIQTANAGGRGDAGSVKITATGDVRFDGRSGTLSTIESGATGKGGDIAISTSNLSITNGAELQALTKGKGDAGSVKITATGDVRFDGRSGTFSTVESGATGKGGDIAISTNNLGLANGSSLVAATRGKGDAGSVKITATGAVRFDGGSAAFSTLESGAVGKGGDIAISTNNFALTNGSQLQSSTRGQGDAGNVNITATGVAWFDRSTAFSTIESGAVGKGGDIAITTRNLALTNGSQLQALTNGKGDAGSVKITATGDVSFDGGSATLTTVSSSAEGKGGNIAINTNNLALTNGSQLATSTIGQGDAGSVKIIATGNINFDAGSIAFSTVESGAAGKGGDIAISTRNLTLTNGASFVASTRGKGDAGTITINATDFVTITGQNNNATGVSTGLSVRSESSTGAAGDIFVTSPKIIIDSGRIDSSSASGKGGNIQIGGKLPTQFVFSQSNNINPSEVGLLILRRGSRIATDAGGTIQEGGNGGNITITAPNGFIVTAPNENSDISANAFSGSGGKVTINTQQNFWISPLSRAEIERLVGTTDPTQLNAFSLKTNDITAISQVNPNLNGQVTITPPEVDPSRGLSPLPNNITDPSNQINPNCSAKAIANNSFTSVGRGGIPASPKAPLNEENIATNWVKLNPQDTTPSTSVAATPAQPQPFGFAQGKPIVEAQAWRRENNGDIVLVASSASSALPLGSTQSKPYSQPSAQCPVN